MERTNKEIAEAAARNLAKWNEATRVENKPSRKGASYDELVTDGWAYFAAKEAKIAEFMQKK